MRQADDDKRSKQIAMGLGILSALTLVGCGALIGWRHLPGLLGEWVGMMVGVMTSPFFLEASLAIIGFTLVLAINAWRHRRAGDECVYLEPEQELAGVSPRTEAPQELRFTRSGQALVFWLLAAILAAAATTLLATSFCRDINPQLPHPLWALPPFLLAALAARIAVKLTRHAYLILTPIGIEIFPFRKPAERMRMVPWQDVAGADVNTAATSLTLHHDAHKSSGIVLSLRPIRADLRPLLVKAVGGRVAGA